MMEFLFSWGKPGSEPNSFVLPFGISVGPNGVFVTDQGEQQVKKFDLRGNFVQSWGKFGTLPGEFYKPKGLTQDSRGRMHVVDFGNHRGQAFTPSGRFLCEWGEGLFSPASTPAPGSALTGKVLQPLSENLIAVFNFDNATKKWSFYNPHPHFAAVNSLTEIVTGQIYWIKVKQEQTVTLNGKKHNLFSGWNLITW